MAFILGEFLRSQPSVPKIKPINVGEEQLKTIAGNQAALPAAEKFAGGVNDFNLQQWMNGLETAFPNFSELNNTISGNALSMARGEVPISDRNMAWIQNSAKAYGGGYSGSGMDSARLARNFGLQTLAVQQEGQNSFQSWMKSLDVPKPIDMSPMFVTAEQGVTTAFKNQENQFQRDYLKNTMDAQFSTGSRLAATEDSFMKML